MTINEIAGISPTNTSPQSIQDNQLEIHIAHSHLLHQKGYINDHHTIGIYFYSTTFTPNH